MSTYRFGLVIGIDIEGGVQGAYRNCGWNRVISLESYGGFRAIDSVQVALVPVDQGRLQKSGAMGFVAREENNHASPAVSSKLVPVAWLLPHRQIGSCVHPTLNIKGSSLEKRASILRIAC